MPKDAWGKAKYQKIGARERGRWARSLQDFGTPPSLLEDPLPRPKEDAHAHGRAGKKRKESGAGRPRPGIPPRPAGPVIHIYRVTVTGAGGATLQIDHEGRRCSITPSRFKPEQPGMRLQCRGKYRLKVMNPRGPLGPGSEGSFSTL
jgi:hypothetical protein